MEEVKASNKSMSHLQSILTRQLVIKRSMFQSRTELNNSSMIERRNQEDELQQYLKTIKQKVFKNLDSKKSDSIAIMKNFLSGPSAQQQKHRLVRLESEHGME